MEFHYVTTRRDNEGGISRCTVVLGFASTLFFVSGGASVQNFESSPRMLAYYSKRRHYEIGIRVSRVSKQKAVLQLTWLKASKKGNKKACE